MNKEVDVVFGSRLLNENETSKMTLLLHIGRISITWIANTLFKSNLTDAYTCYKLFPADFAKSLNITSNGFELEAELTAKTLLAGKKIKDIEQPAGSSIVALYEGKNLIIPKQTDEIKIGQKVLILTKRDVADKVRKMVQ